MAMILLYHATAKAVMLGFPAQALQKTTIPHLKRELSHVFALLCDELVGKCREWLKEFFGLRKSHERSITAAKLYRYLSVILFSQCTCCSFTKTLYMLGKLGGQTLDADILNYINSNSGVFS